MGKYYYHHYFNSHFPGVDVEHRVAKLLDEVTWLVNDMTEIWTQVLI